jgi:hypothetical protein
MASMAMLYKWSDMRLYTGQIQTVKTADVPIELWLQSEGNNTKMAWRKVGESLIIVAEFSQNNF